MFGCKRHSSQVTHGSTRSSSTHLERAGSVARRVRAQPLHQHHLHAASRDPNYHTLTRATAGANLLPLQFPYPFVYRPPAAVVDYRCTLITKSAGKRARGSTRLLNIGLERASLTQLLLLFIPGRQIASVTLHWHAKMCTCHEPSRSLPYRVPVVCLVEQPLFDGNCIG
jgi:hypothetical protein